MEDLIDNALEQIKDDIQAYANSIDDKKIIFTDKIVGDLCDIVSDIVVSIFLVDK